MKILEQGRIPSQTIHRVTCLNCSTRFEFSRFEATLGTDRNEDYLSIHCPLCRRECFLSI